MAKKKTKKQIKKRSQVLSRKTKVNKKVDPLKSTKEPLVQKFIFVTGGVISSIGKGLSAASLGSLLEARGYKVSLMKCDPYINVDPGTMSPLQHGEVYVTDDGAETDLDLGHYERFTSNTLTRSNSVTTGQIYENVIAKERRGEYLGGTVQVIPHITNEIKARIFEAAQGSEIGIIEIGGTVGDIEGLPFIEAIRQMRVDLGTENTLFIHVTFIPYIASAGELKSKPTQHSVKELREVGIQPDFLICRSEKFIPPEIKSKIGLFCSVRPENVIAATDSKSIYEVPLALEREKLDELVLSRLGLDVHSSDMSGWTNFVDKMNSPKETVRIGIIGKYVDLKESYKSLHEALVHGGIENRSQVDVIYIDSEKITDKNVSKMLVDVDGVLVPGGFGERGIEGKITAIKYAREKDIPFFGICYGMQLAAIEFARNVCGFHDAVSREFSESVKKKSKNIVIDFMDEQKNEKNKGGTMRLGAFPCHLKEGSRVNEIYGESDIYERHRHRYEFNNRYKPIFEKNGITLSGVCVERDLVEIIEISQHSWFVGVQFHPEFKSKPLSPHPLFVSFVEASLSNQKKTKGFANSSRKKTVKAMSKKSRAEKEKGIII